MASPFPGTVDALARRAFKAEARKMSPDEQRRFKAWVWRVSLATATATGVALWQLGPLGEPRAAIALAGAMTVPMLVGILARPVRRLLKAPRLMRAYRAGDPEAVALVPAFAIRRFRQQIAKHRARTLGRDSEWEKARDPLDQARNEARRQLSYWWARMAREPDSPLVRENLDRADQLEAKLGAALGKVDSRADLLQRFYDDCEARISVMSQDAEDLAHSLRLRQLSASVDARIARAEEALARIGGDFVDKAQHFAGVLGSFERLQITVLAGETPLDDIERLADRIIESHDRDCADIEKLAGALGE